MRSMRGRHHSGKRRLSYAVSDDVGHWTVTGGHSWTEAKKIARRESKDSDEVVSTRESHSPSVRSTLWMVRSLRTSARLGNRRLVVSKWPARSDLMRL